MRDFPSYVVEHFFRTDSLADNTLLFDFLIYLHGSASEDPIGLTMMFAHELQHLVQFVSEPQAWQANERSKEHWETLAGFLGVRQHHFPIEVEARLVAKRVTTSLYGGEPVSLYIERQTAAPTDDYDGANWRFIETLSVSQHFDLRRETDALMRRLSPFLQPK